MPPNPDIKGWEVVSQRSTYGLDSRGQTVQGIEVTFRLKSGTTSTVFLAKDDYTVDNVKAAILEHAAHLMVVDQLKG